MPARKKQPVLTESVKTEVQAKLVPEALDYLTCEIDNLESCVSGLDEDLTSVINKGRADLATTESRENLCDVAFTITVLADRVNEVVQRVRNIVGYLEL